jgi:hypothetical protein
MEAAQLYVKGQVTWELGQEKATLNGGHNRLTGRRSYLEVSPVIATFGVVRKSMALHSVTNAMLFKRDNFRCMYCGEKFGHKALTRDHIFPQSRGGLDTWENLVAACKACNQAKADRTPEEAGMALLAIPFRPNIYERFFLSNHQILGDQMEYLETKFSGQRIWQAA